MKSATDVQAEIQGRLGIVPSFFTAADNDPGLMESLWRQTLWGALDNPVPETLKRRVFFGVAANSPVPAALLGHGCALGLLKPDPVQLRGLVPGAAAVQSLESLSSPGALAGWPDPDSEGELAVASAALSLAREGETARRADELLCRFLGADRAAHLNLFVDWIKASARWLEQRPGAAREMAQFCPQEVQRDLAAAPRQASRAKPSKADGPDEFSAALEICFRSLLDHFPAAISVKDIKGRYIAANPRFLQLAGETSTPRGSTDYDLFPTHLAENYRANDMRVLMQKAPLEFEETYETRGKQSLHSTVRFPLLGPGNDLRGICAISTDVTGLKRAEKVLALFDQSEKQKSALLKLGRNLSSAANRPSAARAILQAADELFGWDACYFNLYIAEEEVTCPIFHADIIEEKRVVLDPDNVRRKPSPMTRRILASGPELILRGEPIEFPPDAVRFGDCNRPSASIMTVPVRLHQRTIGLLSVQSYRFNAYTSDDLETLQSLGDYCAWAIDSLRSS